MFYSVEVLAGKGKLAAAWAAAHAGTRRLSRTDLEKVSIKEVILSIEKGNVPVLSLRTSSHILLGLSRILLKQSKYLYRECNAFLEQAQRKEVERKPSRDNLKSVRREPDPYFAALILFRSQAKISEQGIPVDVDLPRGSFSSDATALVEHSFASSLNCISFTESFGGATQIDHSVISLQNLGVSGAQEASWSAQGSAGTSTIQEGSAVPDMQEKETKRKHSDRNPSEKRHKTDKSTTVISATLRLVSRIENQYALKNKSRFALLLPLGLRACFLPDTAAENPEPPEYICAPESIRDVSQNSIEIPRHASLDSFQIVSPDGDRSLHAALFPQTSFRSGSGEVPASLEKEGGSGVSALSFGGCEGSFLSIGSIPQEAENAPNVPEKTAAQLQIAEAAKFAAIINARTEGPEERECRLSAFVSLLELLGRGAVEARQSKPYGSIEVHACM